MSESAGTALPIRTIGLVQINNSFSGAVYFPYSVGLMQAYYQQYGRKADGVTFLEPVFERLPVEEAVGRLREADLVAFSVYAWNLQLSLMIAQALKKAKPEVLIVFGGPQTPRESGAFLNQYSFVDAVSQGEGEGTLTELIDYLNAMEPGSGWGQVRPKGLLLSDLPALSFKDRSGHIIIGREFARNTDLDRLPSPYLSGVFDQLLVKYPDRQWLALWETNRGCPFSCAFCDWGAPEQRRMYRFSTDRAKAELRWFAEHGVDFVFCCDSNFGFFERDVDLADYAAQLKQETGRPQALSVQNAKNATARTVKIQKTLSGAGLNKGVTLALQSASPLVLANIHRKNVSFSVFSDLQRRFNEAGIETYTDMIICLPGETYNSFLRGIDLVINSGQFNRIQFINLSILPNSKMAEPDYMLRHGLETVESRCVNIHGRREDGGAIAEWQRLVIGSAAMPPADWARVRAWAWMCSLLFFDKLLQLPLVLASALKKIPVSWLVEKFLTDSARYPRLSEIHGFFQDEAYRVQQGGAEYYYSPDFLDIYWPHDEYCLINLVVNRTLDDLYAEMRELLAASIFVGDDRDFLEMMDQAIILNRALMRQGESDDLEIKVYSDIWGFYQARRNGLPGSVRKGETVYRIERCRNWDDQEDWMRQVIWYGNKKGAYWWPIRNNQP